MKARRLQYAPEALDDLRYISRYLKSEAGLSIANRVVQRLRGAIGALRETPGAGTPRPDFGADCRFIVSRPYVIYYAYARGILTVLRVLHAARDRDRIMQNK